MAEFCCFISLSQASIAFLSASDMFGFNSNGDTLDVLKPEDDLGPELS